MKFLSAIFLLNIYFASAQTNDKPVRLIHYALDSFINGTVKLKSGEISTQLLNYNLVTKEMIFEKGRAYLAIANPEKVDTIYLKDRKFIPAGDAFYELLGGSTFPLFIEYTCTIKEQGANTGFGTTNTSATTSVKSLMRDGGAYALKLPDEYQIIPGQSFYIRKNSQYYKVNNEQQIIKLFPEKKELIKAWVKNNHTSFSKTRDMLLLAEQIQ